MISKEKLQQELAVLNKMRGLAHDRGQIITAHVYDLMVASYARMLSQNEYAVVLNDKGKTVLQCTRPDGEVTMKEVK